MEDNTKIYYTPELWELCHGLKYELFYHGEKRWVEGEFYLENPMNELYPEKLLANEIRVKSLDREDLESLGFIFKGNDTLNVFVKDIFLIRNYKSCDGYWVIKLGGDTLYIGKIRNLFHLRQLLKDIGYLSPS
jgi:hypothetical protein